MTVLDEQPVLDDRETAAFDFDAFVARHSLRLRRVLARRTGDIHEAEEVLQEALLRAYQHRDAFQDDDGAAAWTTVVAQRLAVDRHRVARRSLAVAEVPEGGRVDRDTADVVIASSEARVALDVLANLPRRQAAILWAREVEGLSYAEIAERLELTEPTVRTVLSRGRQALRKEFLRRGHAVPAAGLAPFAPALLMLRGSEELGRPVRRLLEMKVLGAAAAAVLAAGVITAGAPWIAAAEPDRALSPSSGGAGLIQLPPAAPADAADPAAATPAESTTSATTGSSAAGGAGAPVAGREGPLVPLPQTCAGTVTAGACVDDAPPAEGDQFELQLPDNPTGITRPGVLTNHIKDCSNLPDVPLLDCTADPKPGDS